MHRVGAPTAVFGCYMAGVTWNCCHFGACSVHTIQPCRNVQRHFMQSHMCRTHVCLELICHLHFWQNDQDLPRDTALTRGFSLLSLAYVRMLLLHSSPTANNSAFYWILPYRVIQLHFVHYSSGINWLIARILNQTLACYFISCVLFWYNRHVGIIILKLYNAAVLVAYLRHWNNIKNLVDKINIQNKAHAKYLFWYQEWRN